MDLHLLLKMRNVFSVLLYELLVDDRVLVTLMGMVLVMLFEIYSILNNFHYHQLHHLDRVDDDSYFAYFYS